MEMNAHEPPVWTPPRISVALAAVVVCGVAAFYAVRGMIEWLPLKVALSLAGAAIGGLAGFTIHAFIDELRDRRRPGHDPTAWTWRRRWFTWMNLTAMSTLTFVALVALYVVLLMVPRRNPALAAQIQFDWTRDSRWEMSQDTIGMLQELRRNVSIYLLPNRNPEVQPDPGEGAAWAAVSDLLNSYAETSMRVQFEALDPENIGTRELLFRLAGLQYLQTFLPTIVVVAWPEDVGDNPEGEIPPTFREIPLYQIYRGGPRGSIEEINAEEFISTAILQVTSEDQRVVYWTADHGEIQPWQGGVGTALMFGQMLQQRLNAEIRPLVDFDFVPPDCELLIIIQPVEEFDRPNLDALSAYLERGGRLLVLQDGSGDSNLFDFLRDHGADLSRDLLLQGRGSPRWQTNDLMTIIGAPAAAHPITGPLMGPSPTPVRLIVASPVVPIPARAAEYTSTGILQTAVECPRWEYHLYSRVPQERPNPAQVPEIQPLCVVVDGRSGDDGRPGYRMVVLGSGLSAEDSRFSNVPETRETIFNCVKWLLGDTARISAPPKQLSMQPLLLEPEEKQRIMYITVLLMPCLALTLMVWTWASRRR